MELMVGNKKGHIYLNYLISDSDEDVIVKARGKNILNAINVLLMYQRTVDRKIEFAMTGKTLQREDTDGKIYKISDIEIQFKK